MMILHTQAVAKGLQSKFLIADLPFLSFRKSISETMMLVEQLIQAGAAAVKIEGAKGNLESIQHIVESGVPVMGHVGLTPQSLHVLGGCRVQGKEPEIAEKIMQDANALQAAGCFSIVLECIPAELAKTVTENLAIPTIGIGAGPATDGQVLVLHDLLGMQNDFNPKFLKTYLNGFELMKSAIDHYVDDVNSSVYPELEQHCY